MTTSKYFDRIPASTIHLCLLFTFVLCGACSSAFSGTATLEREKVLRTQEFFCHTRYDLRQCEERIAELKALLLQYPAASPKHWSWIIVRSEDWQPLVQTLHLDRRSPAFTALTERETFLEDALFFPQPGRTDELVKLLHTPLDQLLSMAVSHELGHAICHNGNEATANHVGEQLRSGRYPDCFDTRKPLGPVEELILHNQSPGFPHLH
jgi:hypothetical protein